MHFLTETADNTPFEFISNHIHLIGWPALCRSFLWIGKTLQHGIHEYKEDRAIIRETKLAVDVKTDKALVIMADTKATVEMRMMNNHLHTIRARWMPGTRSPTSWWSSSSRSDGTVIGRGFRSGGWRSGMGFIAGR